MLTNHPDEDPDINNQPFLFLWPPPKVRSNDCIIATCSPCQALDSHLRKYQHVYYIPLYASLYMSWRIQSFQWAVAHRNWSRLALIMLPSCVVMLVHALTH